MFACVLSCLVTSVPVAECGHHAVRLSQTKEGASVLQHPSRAGKHRLIARRLEKKVDQVEFVFVV